MDGHDSPRIGNNDIDYKPTKLLSAFLKGRVQQSVKVAYYEDIKNILEVKENNDE